MDTQADRKATSDADLHAIQLDAKPLPALHCDSCQVLAINGLKCHEIGCPDAWQDYALVCQWCGMEFMPKERNQQFCDTSCAESYN